MVDTEYEALKFQLNEEELQEIEELEKDRDNLDVDYWDLYKKAYKFEEGKNFTWQTILASYNTPVHKMRLHILHQAAALRGKRLGG